MQHSEIPAHMHLRQRARRAHSVHYAYPSSNRFIKRLDGLMYFVGIIGPLVSIPQLIEIYDKRSAEGISVLTWAGYTVMGLFWLAYGVVHREKPIIITQCLWLVMNGAILIGALLY